MGKSTNEILELLGDPHEVDRDLARFSRTARILSADYAGLAERYPKQWVAAYDGKVRAVAKSLELLLSQIDTAGLPRNKVIVRFLNKDQKMLIL